MSQVTVVAKVMEVEMDVNIPKNGGGVYKGTRIIYRDKEGSLKEQNIHSNALKFNPSLKESISGLVAGEQFTMTKEKEGEFWNVKSIVKGVVSEAIPAKAGASSGKEGNSSPRSTYETPEERAQKQIYIVRQSSITNAIALSGLNKKAMAPSDIIKIAQEFEAYVFGNEFDDGSIEGLQSDIV